MGVGEGEGLEGLGKWGGKSERASSFTAMARLSFP